jgi:hypothetical protein
MAGENPGANIGKNPVGKYNPAKLKNNSIKKEISSLHQHPRCSRFVRRNAD